MIRALLAEAQGMPTKSASRLRIVCGDAIGAESLHELAPGSPRRAPVWCVSTGLLPLRATSSLTGDVQIPAEILTALVAVLDESMPDVNLSASLAKLSLSPDQALGRSLRFQGGERTGNDLGHVLSLPADRTDVLAYARDSSGRWISSVLPSPNVLAER
jgi:hypothetical protein